MFPIWYLLFFLKGKKILKSKLISLWFCHFLVLLTPKLNNKRNLVKVKKILAFFKYKFYKI